MSPSWIIENCSANGWGSSHQSGRGYLRPATTTFAASGVDSAIACLHMCADRRAGVGLQLIQSAEQSRLSHPRLGRRAHRRNPADAGPPQSADFAKRVLGGTSKNPMVARSLSRRGVSMAFILRALPPVSTPAIGVPPAPRAARLADAVASIASIASSRAVPAAACTVRPRLLRTNTGSAFECLASATPRAAR